MKSTTFQQAMLALLIAGGLAACNGNDTTPSTSIDTAATAPIADPEAMAEINAPTDPSMAPIPPMTDDSMPSATDGTAMDGNAMNGSMAADGSVMGNAMSPTRCEGLVGQAMTDCIDQEAAEARRSDSTTPDMAPTTPPSQ